MQNKNAFATTRALCVRYGTVMWRCVECYNYISFHTWECDCNCDILLGIHTADEERLSLDFCFISILLLLLLLSITFGCDQRASATAAIVPLFMHIVCLLFFMLLLFYSVCNVSFGSSADLMSKRNCTFTNFPITLACCCNILFVIFVWFHIKCIPFI